jgi:nitroreductase
MRVRGALKQIAIRLPVIGRWFYVAKYRWVEDEKTIRARIQQVAHRIDLHISQNRRAPYDAIRECEFLIDRMRGKSVDEAFFWALAVYAIALHQLQDGYLRDSGTHQLFAQTSQCKADLVATIKERRSIRKWTADTIDYEVINDAIDLAKWAPSSCNRQTWQVLLVDRQQDREFLRNYFSNKFWLSAPLLIVVMIDVAPYHEFEKHYAYLDAGAFIQNLLLTLHARGYGACWIGFAKWDALSNVHTDRSTCKAFYEHFKLSAGLIPVSMVAVGRAAIKPTAPFRQSKDSIIIKH